MRDKRETRRDGLVDVLADAVLAAGLPHASLRPLAAAAGTSDRMLLYYFGSKEALVSAVLERIAERLAATLDAAVPAGVRLSADALGAALWAGMSAPTNSTYMRLWFDLAGGAARGDQTYRAVGGRIVDLFHGWIADRLDVAEAERPRTAAALFASLEGSLLIAALGRPETAALAISPPAPADG